MSTNEEIIESTDDKQQTTDHKTEEDEELNALLDSALNDFQQSKTNKVKDVSKQVVITSTASMSITEEVETKSEPLIEGSFEENLSSDFAKFDEMFTPLISADPQLKEHWTKLTQSCSEAANATNDEEFQNSLQETLKTISDKAQSVVGQDNNLTEEELAKIWSNLGIGGDDESNGTNSFANLMPLMTNMMQNLLSKELLYPALSELVEKYPSYLDENKDKLTADDLKRYTKQMELMKEVCDEFDAEREDDSEQTKKERFQRILAVMQSMQNCGSPPTQLIGDVPDFTAGLPPDLKLPDMPNFSDGQNPGQCLLM